MAILSSLVTHAGARRNVRRREEATMRTFMTVEYDYKLEANKTAVNTTDGGDNIFSKFPLEDALLDIDTDLVSFMQNRIPNGDIPEGETMPDVQFNSVDSRFTNMCFTESDACKWTKSRIKLSFVGARPKAAMERVTLDLVQEYMQGINDAMPTVTTTYVYPIIHSSTVQLEFSPVERQMSDTEILQLEGSFYNVYHAIVAALDGDTDVSEAYFVYQSFLEEESTLMVNVKYFGKCRYCNETELVAIVNGQIEAHTKAFMTHLRINGKSTYFEDIDTVTFSLPQNVNELTLPPIDSSIVDEDARMAKKKIPWLLYVGAPCALIVLVVGVWIIFRDQKELRKEEAETGQESDSYEASRHEGADESASDDSDAMDDAMDDASRASSSLNTDTLNTNGMHSDYEVYVY